MLAFEGLKLPMNEPSPTSTSTAEVEFTTESLPNNAPDLNKDKRASESITDGIQIRAFPEFCPEQSNPRELKYLFSYQIFIKNDSGSPVKLLSRHWRIIDANGHTEEVKGPGVVGETPMIDPGDEYSYNSFCPLATHWGTMEGSYEFERTDGSTFEAKIKRFYLAKL